MNYCCEDNHIMLLAKLKNLQSLCRSCHNIKIKKEKQSRQGGSKSLQTEELSTDCAVKFSQSPIRGGGV